MKKQDLVSGMILETRNVGRYLLLSNSMVFSLDGFIRLENYSDDLKNKNNKDYDIIKVYENEIANSLTTILDDEYLILIWERKETKLTDREVVILKALRTMGYEWLARDKDNTLYAYLSKPIKVKYNWHHADYWFLKPFKSAFNFIKWKDKEPASIDDLLKGV